MTTQEYNEKLKVAYNSGRITAEVYNVMAENAAEVCDEKCYGLPIAYAEIEYSDFDNAEAIDGARFDDMNYSRYTER